MLLSLITALHVFVALFMILVVLLQGGNSGGIGATLGGGNSSGVFGATGANSMLTKLTYIAAVVFMITSLSLSIMKSKAGTTGIYDKMKQEATQQQQDTTTTPAPEGVLDNLEKINDNLLEQRKADQENQKATTSQETKETKKEVTKKEDKKDSSKTESNKKDQDQKPSKK